MYCVSGRSAPVSSGDGDGAALVPFTDDSGEGGAGDPVADAKGMPVSSRKTRPAILL